MEEKLRRELTERLVQVSEEFSTELTTNKEELQARHKKQLGEMECEASLHVWYGKIDKMWYVPEQQYEKLMAEKEEAIQDLERTFKRKLIDAETKFRYLLHRSIRFTKICCFVLAHHQREYFYFLFFFKFSFCHFLIFLYKFCMFLYTKPKWWYCAV